VELQFSGPLWYWRGPPPFYFVTVPEAHCELISSASGAVSYGWGMIPVTATVNGTTWSTSLWPKDGAYIVPVKAAVRAAEHLVLDEDVQVCLRVNA
jgi:hypothetical protein